MDLWRLRIFQKVVEYESFSNAAKAVNLSQPTISSHIKDLEEHFGCRLIDRLEKKAVPTKAGKLLYHHIGRLLRRYKELEAAMSEFHGKLKGHLEIGGSTIPGGYILPKIIGGFVKDYPQVQVSLIVGDTKKITDDILSGVLEIGVVGAKLSDKRLFQEVLVDDEMRLIIPADHPWSQRKSISISELTKEPLIIRESGSGTLMSIESNLHGKELGSKDFNIVAQLGSTTSVIQGIKSKVGVSILSTIAVTEELQAGSLKALKINGIDLKRKFYLTKYKNKTESPLGKIFIKFIRQYQQSLLKELKRETK